jgi:hypothetical protein
MKYLVEIDVDHEKFFETLKEVQDYLKTRSGRLWIQVKTENDNFTSTYQLLNDSEKKSVLSGGDLIRKTPTISTKSSPLKEITTMNKEHLKQQLLTAKTVKEFRELKDKYGDSLVKSTWLELNIHDRIMIHYRILKPFPIS